MRKVTVVLSWKFRKVVLRVFDFHDIWINWVICYCSTISMKLLLTGTIFSSFKQKRGMTQSNPVYSYLFILAIDVLSRLVASQVENGISSFKFSIYVQPLHHFFFFFCGRCLLFRRRYDKGRS